MVLNGWDLDFGLDLAGDMATMTNGLKNQCCTWQKPEIRTQLSPGIGDTSVLFISGHIGVEDVVPGEFGAVEKISVPYFCRR